MLNDLLKQLIKDLEMDDTDLAAEENGKFLFHLDEENTVSFRSLEPAGVEMFSKIRSCPDVKLEALFTQMMTGNLFGEQTGGAVIALDDEGKNFTLSLRLSYEMGYSEFYGQVENFLNHVDFWKSEIDNHEKQSSGKSRGLLY